MIMGIISELADEKLIFLDDSSLTTDDFFENIATRLEELEYVTPTFYKAISEREKVFPTGLQLEYLTVAIPHTDVQHIRKPFISIHRIQNEQLSFIQMGTNDVKVLPQYILVLGIKEPKNQITLLSTLIELFSQPDFINKVESVLTEREMFELLNNY